MSCILRRYPSPFPWHRAQVSAHRMAVMARNRGPSTALEGGTGGQAGRQRVVNGSAICDRMDVAVVAGPTLGQVVVQEDKCRTGRNCAMSTVACSIPRRCLVGRSQFPRLGSQGLREGLSSGLGNREGLSDRQIGITWSQGGGEDTLCSRHDRW